MTNEKKTIERILKLKKYLEVYFQNTNQIAALNGVEFCRQWLMFLQRTNAEPTEIANLEALANVLGNDNHALQEIKYEFDKWRNQLKI